MRWPFLRPPFCSALPLKTYHPLAPPRPPLANNITTYGEKHDDDDRDDGGDSKKKKKDVRVVFPQEANGLSRGFRQLPWNSDTMLSDYLPLVQAAVVKSWTARKKLVATLALRHSVLEYDAQDFTMVHLMMKVPS